jgi:hypothetical protein
MATGKNTNEEWQSKLRNYPAPWGELEITNYLTITYPSSAMRKVEDMEGLAAFYNKMTRTMADLSGTKIMIRHERIVYDITPSGKYEWLEVRVWFVTNSQDLMMIRSALTSGVKNAFRHLSSLCVKQSAFSLKIYTRNANDLIS